MKRIPLFLTVCLLTWAVTPAIADNQPLLQFRLVVDRPVADSEQMTQVESNARAGSSEVLNVQKAVLLDQTSVKQATTSRDALGQPVVNIEFSDIGAKQFAAITRDNVGRRLAINVDGKLISAPRIAAEISGGRAEITGRFTERQAQGLAMQLNGSPASEAHAGGRVILFAIAALFIIAVGVAMRFAIRRGGVSKAA